LFKEWGAYRDAPFEYKKADTWDRLVHQGAHLLQRFVQDDRVIVHDPDKNLQIKILRSLPGGAEFVAYMDAIGEIDGTRCLIDWKTTTSRYPDGPEGLLSLDPQLICYSWMSGISDVAFGGIRSEAGARDPIFADCDLGRTTAGVRSVGRNNDKPDRVGQL
jgi:hypothetical protein